MSVVSKHFEIQTNIGEGWVVQQVSDTEGEAVQLAKPLVTKADDTAVQVLEVSFSEKSQDYRELEVFSAGNCVLAPQRPDGDDFQPFCTDYEAFYTGDAHRAIIKLLKQPLQQWQITVPELLYGAAYLKKLTLWGLYRLLSSSPFLPT